MAEIRPSLPRGQQKVQEAVSVAARHGVGCECIADAMHGLGPQRLRAAPRAALRGACDGHRAHGVLHVRLVRAAGLAGPHPERLVHGLAVCIGVCPRRTRTARVLVEHCGAPVPAVAHAVDNRRAARARRAGIRGARDAARLPAPVLVRAARACDARGVHAALVVERASGARVLGQVLDFERTAGLDQQRPRVLRRLGARTRARAAEPERDRVCLRRVVCGLLVHVAHNFCASVHAATLELVTRKARRHFAHRN